MSTANESPASNSGSLTETVIAADPRLRLIQAIKDLWEYRDLFRAFIARDIKVRYKQTALGVVWVVLQPLLGGGIFAAIFRNLGSLSDETGAQVFLFFMAGLVPWMSFASGVQNASTALELNANLITKVYFPRMAAPGAFVAGSIIDYAIAFAVLVVIAALLGSLSVALIVIAPLLLLIQVMTAMGLGLALSALNAQYRDVKYAIPFLLMIGMFVSVFPTLETMEGMKYQIASLNPMLVAIETYRMALDGRALDWGLLAKGAVVGLVLLTGGVAFFRSRESKLVDIL